MPSLFNAIKKSFERFIQHPVFGMLRCPDPVDEAAEIRRAGDAGCLGNEPVTSTRAKPSGNPGGHDASTTVNAAEKPAVKRKFISQLPSGKWRVRICGERLRLHVGVFDDLKTAVRRRNLAVKCANQDGWVVKCGARD